MRRSAQVGSQPALHWKSVGDVLSMFPYTMHLSQPPSEDGTAKRYAFLGVRSATGGQSAYLECKIVL